MIPACADCETQYGEYQILEGRRCTACSEKESVDAMDVLLAGLTIPVSWRERLRAFWDLT